MPILGCYVAPSTPPKDFKRILSIASRSLQGPGILVGDLNSRHTAWDKTTNRQGRQLHRWAQAHRFLTQRPSFPTIQTTRGNSCVEVILHRSPRPPTIKVHGSILGSDHRPVTAHLFLSTPSTLRYSPLPVLANRRCRERAQDQYKETIPNIIDALTAASSPASLEISSGRLAAGTLEPWAAMCPQRPTRFRPGWTISLDRMAKKRKKLLQSTDPADENRAKDLDKKIKRRFRLNKRRMTRNLADELENANPTTEGSIMKRALALEGNNEVAPTKVDADDFTNFIQSMQPSLQTTPIVHINKFEVPDSFLQTLITAITIQVKSKKSPGPDMIRTDIFKLTPMLFAKAALELWRAVGRLASMPLLLRSGLLVPIYKGKGDSVVPSNNRPITLTPAYRRLICTAIVIELRKKYRESVENQWGFQERTNTECAIIFAVNKLRANLPYAVLLDLKKVYDCVPQHKLQQMVDKQLPVGLSNTIRALLWPMRLKTKNKISPNSILTVARVPHGDPQALCCLISSWTRCCSV